MGHPSRHAAKQTSQELQMEQEFDVNFCKKCPILESGCTCRLDQ